MGEEADKNYQGSAVRKGVCGPTMCYVFSFSARFVFVDCINGPFETETNSLCNRKSVFAIMYRNL